MARGIRRLSDHAAMRIALSMLALAAIAACKPSPVAVAENDLREHLRDPVSVTFRNVAPRGSRVCGEFNAKNGFGGYAGFARFVAETPTSGPEGKVTIEPAPDVRGQQNPQDWPERYGDIELEQVFAQTWAAECA